MRRLIMNSRYWCALALLLFACALPAWPFEGPLQVRHQFPILVPLDPPYLESAAVRDAVAVSLSHSSVYVTQTSAAWTVNMDLELTELMVRLKKTFPLSHERVCMHEFVLEGKLAEAPDIRALDIAKRLIDYGIHPPTNYFPLIVPEALMIEPTETESKETLDAFVDAMERIAAEAKTQPELLHGAPHVTPVGRLDEVRAARQPRLRWKPA